MSLENERLIAALGSVLTEPPSLEHLHTCASIEAMVLDTVVNGIDMILAMRSMVDKAMKHATIEREDLTSKYRELLDTAKSTRAALEVTRKYS